ncbi:hypothetical protein KC343_g6357 [Hortaea werneckii]|nr:hypothetical protein KC352_g26106 [Hortaea werneckii]KAI7564953.1 hypothetical protein KC317_g6698 [Hortaea werneckii]KAI7618054.1 hypothetical protein KC346_g5199 [Hortaea werneckii]KAI7626267.1 hypothetical protein KC343_g6357 [Hortaea werneckii]KAI7661777.1 hypothetical protein KC319_g8325 [Hortaea werneckii]
MKAELDEAQEKVQKLKADLFRAGLGHIKTPKFDWKQSASPSMSAAYKKKKAMGMKDAADYGDQDDSEPDLKKPIPGASVLSPLQKAKRANGIFGGSR